MFLTSTRIKEKMAQAMTALTTYEKTDTFDHGIISDTRGRTITVQIPDMFTSFLSVPPRVSLLHGEVKRESEGWISEYWIPPLVKFKSWWLLGSWSWMRECLEGFKSSTLRGSAPSLLPTPARRISESYVTGEIGWVALCLWKKTY